MKSMADYKLLQTPIAMPSPCQAAPERKGYSKRSSQSCTGALYFAFFTAGEAKETSEQEIVDSKQQLGLSGNRAPQNLMGNHQFFYPKSYVDIFPSFRQPQI